MCTPKSIHLRWLRPTEHSAGPRAGGGTARRWYLTKPLSEIRMTKKSRDEAQTAAVAVALTQLSEPMIFQGNVSIISEQTMQTPAMAI